MSQEPVREDSVDSGLDTETYLDKICTYVVLESRDTLNVTITPQAAKVLHDLMSAFTNKAEAVATSIITGFEGNINLINDIGK